MIEWMPALVTTIHNLRLILNEKNHRLFPATIQGEEGWDLIRLF